MPASGKELLPSGKKASHSTEPEARIPGFYDLSRQDRLTALRDRGWPAPDRPGDLPPEVADKLIENVIGVMGLPIGLAMNFQIDGTDHVIPLAVEEASVVAAASHAAKLVRRAGGFTTELTPPEMIAQVHLDGIDDLEGSAERILAHKQEVLALADALQPNMVARGGGARDLEAHIRSPFLVVHLVSDVNQAMGANVMNSLAEGIAPLLENLSGGNAVMRILSNLTDRRRITVRCRIPVEHLGNGDHSGLEMARGITTASDCAVADHHRAVTHNKGIMNGVDAVLIALGQDWRAVEAGAHAWACRKGVYGPICVWELDKSETHLEGELEMPMAVGIVGGAVKAHPGVRDLLEMAHIGSAETIAKLAAAVGMANNLAALKALSTHGIQRGHMKLHARSLAVAAGAKGEQAEWIARALVRSGEIKAWKAKELVDADSQRKD